MHEETNKNNLEPIDFESYILRCMNDFTNRQKPFLETEYGKMMTDSQEYACSEKTNRNPKQVPGGVWVRLVFKHLRGFSYN